MALAESANLQNVAFALQSRIGYKPDRLRLSLYTEGGKLRALVSGSGHADENFRNVLIPNQDESLPLFVQRCALWGASQLAPYSTSLYLMEKHAGDGNFEDVIALVDHAISVLPPTPRSFDRSLFQNVRGLVALFKNDKSAARAAFDAATQSDPTNPVPFLNAAFTDLQFDEYQRAAVRMQQLIAIAPPANKALLSTAYMTWGAAMIGTKDLPNAERLMAMAVRLNPQGSTALHLWSEVKGLEGDKASSERLEREAMSHTATFENYSEVAALYFRLAWGDNQPVTRSKFSNPTVVTFH
jgi:tetratricopeptide (TPR) repeat protein